MEKRDYLIGFSVEGFRGFTDKCVWDLKRHHKYAFGSEFVYGDVIYRPIVFGPCAAGKTDLGLALMDIVQWEMQRLLRNTATTGRTSIYTLRMVWPSSPIPS